MTTSRLAVAITSLLLAATPEAQEVQRAVTIGAGVANTYDTYLSPLEYRGPQLMFMRETSRMTHWRRVATQGTFALNALYTSSPAGNANEAGGTASYRQSWYYTWTPSPHWTLMAGGGAGANLGFLYNIRNVANNPAQAQLDASMHAAAAATWTWRWLTLRAQAEAPLAGLMFSPEYGQSYYEIFGLKDGGHNVVITHPGNCPTLYTLLTADFRMRRGTIRLGYGAHIVQSTPNNLRRHTYLHTGHLGYVRRFKILR